MTLNVNLLLYHQSYVCCDQTAEARPLESCDFRDKVALYFSYVHVKFDDEINRKSLRISNIISD